MPDSVRQEKGDLISRQDAIEVINKLMEIHFDRKVVLGKVWQQIKDLPSAQKKGHWIDGSCSVCGCDEPMFIEDWNVEHCKTPFCPNCGADMRGEDDGCT